MELNFMITIIDRDKAGKMAKLYHDAGLHMTLTSLGRGTATREHLSLYDLERTDKAIVSAVAGKEEKKQLLKAAKQKMLIDIPGNGIMMSVPIKSVGGGKTLAYLTDNHMEGGKPEMEFQHELIIIILNEGFSDTVMDAARSAGAAGGTVLHAKGTGAARAEKFFGVSLAEEKDVIYIVSKTAEKAAIMRAVNSECGAGTPAGAICFSLPISSVVGLRQLEED